MLVAADDRLPQADYRRQPGDPEWLAQVVQFHGHLGPAVLAGARMGMIGLREVGAKGYFDVEATCEGPMAKPPQACFLDGVQLATGAPMGKRTLTWVQADQILVRVKNTRTGKTVELRPKPALMDRLAAFKPQAKAGPGHGPGSKVDDEQLAAVARDIAVMPEKDAPGVTVVEGDLPGAE
jgi:formylmethanofuran dehydrogenase subunit E